MTIWYAVVALIQHARKAIDSSISKVKSSAPSTTKPVLATLFSTSSTRMIIWSTPTKHSVRLPTTSNQCSAEESLTDICENSILFHPFTSSYLNSQQKHTRVSFRIVVVVVLCRVLLAELSMARMPRKNGVRLENSANTFYFTLPPAKVATNVGKKIKSKIICYWCH